MELSFFSVALLNYTQVPAPCNKLGMQQASHSMRAVSIPPTIFALQSFTIRAISIPAPLILPSFEDTVCATQSATPAADRIWPSHLSCCFYLVTK